MMSGTSTVGPGNVFAGQVPVRVSAVGTIRIEGNGICHDHVTGSVIDGCYEAFDVNGGTAGTPWLIRDNVIAVSQSVVSPYGVVGLGIDVNDNYVGVDRAGVSLGSRAGFTFGEGNWQLANNRIEGVARAIEIKPYLGNPIVRLVNNRITGNDAGIVFTGATAPPVPTISSATATKIQGYCTTANARIEVFADPGDQGATVLGTSLCAAGNWQISGSWAVGLNATATETAAGAGTSAFSPPMLIVP
jgi:hypothetical protein